MEKGVSRSAKTFLSFFSGAMGLDQGLEAAGWHCLAANEFDPVACATIRRNRPSLPLYDQDVRTLTVPRLREDLGLATSDDLFAVVGGPPCQAFSTAGRRLGLNDERGNVFLHFIDLVGGLQPRYAVIENVRGLLSAPLSHRPHDQRGGDWPPLGPDERPGGALSFIVSGLEAYGYTVTFNLYNTANFGVPQIRERLVLLAARGAREIPDLVPTHSEGGRNGLLPWVTFREAVEGLPDEPCDYVAFPERRLRFYRLLRAGQNWRDLPEDTQEEAMGQAYYSGGGKTGFYRRLAWDKPSPTLVTRPNMPATDLGHPSEDRPLSIQEYARIQTFSDDFRVEGRLLDRYRQLGNAVPVRFGEAIGRHLTAHDAGLVLPPPSIELSRYRNTDHRSWRLGLEAGRRQQGALPLGV